MTNDTYKIVRYCADERSPGHRRVIETGLTLEEAQEHCQRDDTHGDGWFDGYDLENPSDEVLRERAERDAHLADSVERLRRLGL